MFLELKFTQKLRSATLAQNSKWLDITLRQTAVKSDASRTQMVVMSFGQGNSGGGNGKLQKHAATHFKGGTDIIKPYDIGAAKQGGDKAQNFKAKELEATIFKILQSVISNNYIGGLFGSGFKLDAQKGELELRKLRVWEELITTTLVKNEVAIMRNETWFTDGGVADSVEGEGGDIRRVKFKEKQSFRVGDLLKAIAEYSDDDGNSAGGVGFRTAQYRVTKIENDEYSVIVKCVNGIYPVKDMVMARVGNDIDKSRQKSLYVDALTGYIRQLGGMDSFEVKAANVLWHLGDTSGLAELGIGSDNYTDALYVPSLHVTGGQVIGGRIEALDGFNLIDLTENPSDGKRMRIGDNNSWMQFLNGVFELVNVKFVSRGGASASPTVWRGEWMASELYFEGDGVSCNGSSYRCKDDAPSGTAPADSTYWELTSQKGADGVGKDGNYTVTAFMWSESKPERPAGSSPRGWCTATDNGAVITDETGQPITDKAGNLLLNPYPKHYKLWSSVATFDGATSEVIGDWGEPYQASATDGEKGDKGQDGTDGKDGDKGDKGEPGADGKDIDPAVQNDIAKQLGFASMPALSDYLADENSFPFFEYDPATKILSVAKILTDAFAANEAFINKLIAQNAFINNLVAKSVNTRTDEGKGRGWVLNQDIESISGYDTSGNEIISFQLGHLNGLMSSMSLRKNDGAVRVDPNDISFYTNGVLTDRFGKNGIFTNATPNMPGMLYAGRVTKTGNLTPQNQWGCRFCTCEKDNGKVGQYKITHNIGHLKYYVTATPMNSAQWNNARLVIKEKTATYVVVAAYDINSADANADTDFEFMICGQN